MSKRPRVRRAIWVLLVLLLLALLLELNQWLPGAWPGGGGGGFLSAEQPATSEKDAAQQRTESSAASLTRIDADETVAPDYPRGGVIVEVRAADGTRTGQWRMGVGDNGPEDHTPTSDGTARATTKRLFREGFRVRAETGIIRHTFGVERPAARWAIYQPSRQVPSRRLQPRVIEVDVVTGDGAAVPGIEIQAYHPRSLEPAIKAKSNEAGRAQVKGQRAVVRLDVDGADAVGRRWVGSTWADPRDREVTPLTVVRADPLRIVGTHPQIAAIRIRTAAGIVLPIHVEPLVSAPTQSNVKTEFTISRPKHPLRGARIEIDFMAGRTTFGTAYAIPQDGVIRLGALATRNVRFGIVSGTVTAIYTPDDAATEAPPLRAQAEFFGAFRTQSGRGGAQLVLPVGVAAHVLVEEQGAAPYAVRLKPDDTRAPAGPSVATSEPGVIGLAPVPGRTLRVSVTDDAGSPLAEADVVYRTAIDGLRVERVARTDAKGHAQLVDLPAAAAELYAHAKGRAWESAVVSADATVARIKLVAGSSLVLAIASIRGAPIQGARVEFRAMDKDIGVAAGDPRTGAYESDAKGILVIPALPKHMYRVRITAPGFRAAKYLGLQPGSTTHFVALAPNRAATDAPK